METDTLRYKYDLSGFAVQLIDIRRRMNYGPNGMTPKNAAIDTSISTFINNKEGKPVMSIVCDPQNDTTSITYNSYLDGERTASYSIGKNGDTTAKASWSKDVVYSREVNINKTLGEIDTTWWIKDKIYEGISHNTIRRSKSRTIYKYDSKGNKIESVTYK